MWALETEVKALMKLKSITSDGETHTLTHTLGMKTKRNNESSKRVCIAVRL